MPPTVALEQLSLARRIADHADQLGVQRSLTSSRTTMSHIGAILADAILQAGVSYRTVVRARVERIHANFPEAATLSGLIKTIDRQGADDFLMWKHPTKVMRFLALTKFLSLQEIDTSLELKQWLCNRNARSDLLNLNGIGPKTCDYLCCLVGIDCIAVDRHIRTFANEAGVTDGDYDTLKSVTSYAADLLGISRRDFDAWIWKITSDRKEPAAQLSLV